MKFLKNISNRFAVAVNTKQGVTNIAKGEKIPFDQLSNLAEVDSLLKRVPAIVKVVEESNDEPTPIIQGTANVVIPADSIKVVVSAPIEAEPEVADPVAIIEQAVKQGKGKRKNKR